MLDHVGRRGAEGHHPPAPPGVGTVRRRHQQSGAALLPVGRRQDRQVPRRKAPPGVLGARRARHSRAVRERALHFPAHPRAARVSPGGSRTRANEDDASGVRDRVRLLPAHAAHALARDESDRALVLRGPGQRDDRLRGSSRPGYRGGNQLRAAHPRSGARGVRSRRRVHRRSGGRPRHARSGRAVPAVHVALRVPVAASPGQRAASARRVGRASRTAYGGRAAPGRGAPEGGGASARSRALHDDHSRRSDAAPRPQRDGACGARARGEGRTSAGRVAAGAARGCGRAGLVRRSGRRECRDRAQVRRLSDARTRGGGAARRAGVVRSPGGPALP